MTLIPGIKQISTVGNDMYIQGAFPVGVTMTEVDYLADPADTRLLAGRDPVIDEVSVGMSGVETDIKTATGAAPLQITDAMKGMLRFLETNILPVQDFYGYANPWPGGGGKNQLNTTADDGNPHGGLIITRNADGSYHIKGTFTSNFNLGVANLSAGTYTFSHGNNGQAPADIYLNIAGVSNSSVSGSNFTLSDDLVATVRFFCTVAGKEFDDDFYPMICLSTSPNPNIYAPYANICPIQGWTGCNVYVSPTTNQADATVYPCTWQDDAGTVYGGTIDLISGFMTVTHEMKLLSQLTWQYNTNNNGYFSTDPGKKNGITNILSSQYLTSSSNTISAMPNYSIKGNANSGLVYLRDWRYTDGATLSANEGNTQICYELATPQYIQVPGNHIVTREGTNYIWSDCGDTITAAYVGKA